MCIRDSLNSLPLASKELEDPQHPLNHPSESQLFARVCYLGEEFDRQYKDLTGSLALSITVLLPGSKPVNYIIKRNIVQRFQTTKNPFHLECLIGLVQTPVSFSPRSDTGDSEVTLAIRRRLPEDSIKCWTVYTNRYRPKAG